MHCALNLTVTRSYRNQANQNTHTHTQKIHSPTCHQSSFHFKVYLGQQALDGPVGTVDPLAEVFYRLMEDPMLYRLQEDTTSEMSSQRAACFKRLKPICESMICNDLSHFHIGSSLLSSHFLKRFWWRFHYEATEEWRDWFTVYALLVPMADFGNGSPKCPPPPKKITHFFNILIGISRKENTSHQLFQFQMI